MTALAKTDWVLVVAESGFLGHKRYVGGTLTLPAALTYPNDGIALPDIGKFGLLRQMDVLRLFGLVSAGETTPPAPLVVLEAVAGLVESGAHSYKTTIITPDGEGLPSPTSNIVTTIEATHGKVTVPRPTGYSAKATHWAVYRTAADDDPDVGTNYVKVGASIIIATTSLLDNVADAARSGVAPVSDLTKAEYPSRYDKTNHKLFLFEEEASAAGGPMLECDTGEVPGPRTWGFYAIGN